MMVSFVGVIGFVSLAGVVSLVGVGGVLLEEELRLTIVRTTGTAIRARITKATNMIQHIFYIIKVLLFLMIYAFAALLTT